MSIREQVAIRRLSDNWATLSDSNSQSEFHLQAILSRATRDSFTLQWTGSFRKSARRAKLRVAVDRSRSAEIGEIDVDESNGGA